MRLKNKRIDVLYILVISIIMTFSSDLFSQNTCNSIEFCPSDTSLSIPDSSRTVLINLDNNSILLVEIIYGYSDIRSRQEYINRAMRLRNELIKIFPIVKDLPFLAKGIKQEPDSNGNYSLRKQCKILIYSENFTKYEEYLNDNFITIAK